MNGNGNRLLAEFVSDGSLKIQNGFPCGKWNDKGVGILHLRPFNISNCGQIDLASTKFVETDKKLDNYLLREGDVIFNNTNSEELVGKTAYWDRDEQSVLSNHMTILRVLERDALDPQFLAFFLLENWFERHFEAICRRHVNQASVNTDRLGALELPSFEAREQKKIAHVLSTVQRAIEAQERIIQTTTELKKTIMHKLFTEGTRGEPQKQTEIGPIPESWEVSLLGNSLSVAQYGLSVKGTTKGDYPILRMTNQVDGQIIGNNLQFVKIGETDFKKFKVEKGDILFNRTNSLDLVGRTAIHDIDGNYVFASYLIRLRTDRKKLNPFFLNLYFNQDETQSRLKSIATRAVSQSNISATKLKGFPIPLPSTKEQVKIVTRTEAIETKLLLHRRKLESLQDLFRTLLHELMTAKIRVNNLSLS